MQRTLVVLSILTLAPCAGATTLADFSFEAPAQLGTAIDLTAANWLLLVMEPDHTTSGSLAMDGVTWTEYHEYGALAKNGYTNGALPFGEVVEGNTTRLERLAGSLASLGIGSLYIEAQTIEVSVLSTQATLLPRERDACLNGGISQVSSSERPGRFEAMCPRTDFGLHLSESTVSVTASNLTLIETHNLDFDCGDSVCPDGEKDRDITSQAIGRSELQSRHLRFHRLSGNGTLQFQGAVSIGLGGGTELMEIGATGHSRFPLASSPPACSTCRTLSDQTLVVDGSLTLVGLQANDGRFRGQLITDARTLKVDEMQVHPEDLFGPTPILLASATASVLLVLKFLLAPLFTRLTKEQALEHPRRKQIFEYIQQHPGANFREVARNTGIAAGTVRHHLNVLERSGQVVEHSHGSTVRLFENHGKFDHNWSDLVLLREPALGKLHDWLKAHPNSPQKAVLEAMEAENWSRSTTQHRLSRLVDGGVASIRLQGRLKMYTVIDRPATKTTGLPAPPRALPV
jgi:predicted transcriptional regulator